MWARQLRILLRAHLGRCVASRLRAWASACCERPTWSTGASFQSEQKREVCAELEPRQETSREPTRLRLCRPQAPAAGRSSQLVLIHATLPFSRNGGVCPPSRSSLRTRNGASSHVEDGCRTPVLGLPGVDGDRDGVTQDVPPPPKARLLATCCSLWGVLSGKDTSWSAVSSSLPRDAQASLCGKRVTQVGTSRPGLASSGACQPPREARPSKAKVFLCSGPCDF